MNITEYGVTVDLFWVLYVIGATAVISSRLERITIIKAIFYKCGLNRDDYMTVPIIVVFWWVFVFIWNSSNAEQDASVDH